ncbi:MAG: baseplate J/gp47 family protein, partial [Waterburya sp.]
MTNLLPLSPVELDPRNQGQIVEAAAQQIYTASGGLINNFSAGSPALCLLEGQAFTNAEFLYWLNKLPNAFLATWLQHYCGIQRKTESFATVNLVFTLSQPLARNFVVFKGYRVRVPNFINESSISFVTSSELVISAGDTTGIVQAVCEVSGTIGNVAANTILQPESNLAFLQSVTNPSAAGGGLDRETESETVSRAFFHTLSYRNPVTESDWVGIIKARTGLDTQVIVKPDRESFIYYFYLLKNIPLSPVQLTNIRSFLKQKMILGYDVVVDNFRDQYIDVYLEISDPDNSITGDEILSFLTQDVFLTNFRFNFSDDVQGLDIASFFAEVFSYLRPNLDKIEVYSTYIDTAIAPTLTTNQTTKYSIGDLIWDGTNYYEVLQPFNSVGANFLDFVSDPILQTDFYLAINGFSVGNYIGGQIVLESGAY